jgi:translation initiation factor 5B
MREIEDEEIPVQKAEVGKIKKNDIVEVENEEPEERAVISFNTTITGQAERLAREKSVEIFNSDVIYEAIEKYQEWKRELQEKQRENVLKQITRPAEIRTMPEHVFRQSDPAVIGVKVVDGVLTPGSTLMSKEGEKIGTLESIQDDGESIEEAEKGTQVAASIRGATIGRTFEKGDNLITDITQKDYQRLQELEDLLSAGEKKVLEEIVKVKDEKNPHWKIG